MKLLLTLAALCAAIPAQAAPNIVVLVADDWGFSDVGSFGGEIATRHIDTLARRGVRFSNFHVAASCSPTRAMLLTGVDNHRNGVGNMPETMPGVHLGKPGYDGVLNDRSVTLATMLHDSGYHTYIAGKWHLGKTAATLPPKRGFERSFIQADSGSDNWEQRPYMFLYDKAEWYEQGLPALLPEKFYSSTFIVDKTLEYIHADRSDRKPFFAYLGFQANHIPLQAPQALVDKYKDRYRNGWTALRKERRDRAIALGLMPNDTPMVTMASTADWDALTPAQKEYESRRMAVYAAMAEAMDIEVGRLVADLKASGQYENTVFVFLSDNGSEPTDPNDILAARAWLAVHYSRELDRMGSKGGFASLGPSWASAAAAPLSTYKFFAGEGGLRTPLVIAGVPGSAANAISPGFAHVTDIVPTLLDVAGVAAHGTAYKGLAVEALTGSSLVPALRDASTRVHPAQQPIGYELSGNAALFKGDYKIVSNMAPVGDGRWHLYNLATDPGETRDLQASEPARFAGMQADYAAYVRANGVLPMPLGYQYMRQGQVYALEHVVLPKLRALLPWLAGLLVAGIALWRWKRAARKAA